MGDKKNPGNGKNVMNMRVRGSTAASLRKLKARVLAETGFDLSLNQLANKCLDAGIEGHLSRPSLTIDMTPTKVAR